MALTPFMIPWHIVPATTQHSLPLFLVTAGHSVVPSFPHSINSQQFFIWVWSWFFWCVLDMRYFTDKHPWLSRRNLINGYFDTRECDWKSIFSPEIPGENVCSKERAGLDGGTGWSVAVFIKTLHFSSELFGFEIWNWLNIYKLKLLEINVEYCILRVWKLNKHTMKWARYFIITDNIYLHHQSILLPEHTENSLWPGQKFYGTSFIRTLRNQETKSFLMPSKTLTVFMLEISINSTRKDQSMSGMNRSFLYLMTW